MIIKLETWEYEYASTIGIRRYTNNWGKPDAPYYNPLKMEDNIRNIKIYLMLELILKYVESEHKMVLLLEKKI